MNSTMVGDKNRAFIEKYDLHAEMQVGFDGNINDANKQNQKVASIDNGILKKC